MGLDHLFDTFGIVYRNSKNQIASFNDVYNELKKRPDRKHPKMPAFGVLVGDLYTLEDLDRLEFDHSSPDMNEWKIYITDYGLFTAQPIP